jgi:hypothetical protein
MHRFAKLLLVSAVLAILYGVWPVYVALEIREAMIAGDTATLNRRIDWDSLRASLKTSLSPETISRLAADPDAPKPSLWQRIKAVVAPAMAETVIDRYVTPENLPALLGYRRYYHGTVRPTLGLEEPKTVLAGSWLGGTAIDRFASFWVRVKSAIFYSPAHLVLEVEDKYRPERRYVGTLEFRGWSWMLTGLRVTGGGL